MSLGRDGIYGCSVENEAQSLEINFRKKVANKRVDNYLSAISLHHSVSVMDREVRLFLKKIPHCGNVIDVGGCWGRHWRNINKYRPDIKVFVVDFVRENLLHAKKCISHLIDKNVFLIHGDATKLDFHDQAFDGYWSVQALQHVPNYEAAIKEAHRVLNRDGVFANYSLNNQFLVRWAYAVLRKNYHTKGEVKNGFYLARSSKYQKDIVENIFSKKLKIRHTEVLFQPDFRLSFTGSDKSKLGYVDKMLSSLPRIFSIIARQESFHVDK